MNQYCVGNYKLNKLVIWGGDTFFETSCIVDYFCTYYTLTFRSIPHF